MLDEITIAEIVLRVGVALVPAAIIGLERELAAQPAGLRTHVLLGLGSALFTLAGLGFTAGDPSRVAAQVASGIGFIGAGAILQEGRLRVRGLTTAASLWVTASVGVAAGTGAYVAVGAVTVAAVLALSVFKWVEREFLPRRRGQSLSVDLDHDIRLSDAVANIRRVSGSFELRQIEPAEPDGQRLVGHTRLLRTQDFIAVAEQLQELPGVRGVNLMR